MRESVEFRLAEIERRLWNLLRLGVIADADYASARVKVQSGDLATGWIPWLTRRASHDIDWWAPEVGEQVLLLSPCGDPAQAVALPALYQSAHPAPEQSADVRQINFGDGTVVKYDRAAKKLSIECVGEIVVVADGDVSVQSGADVNIEAGGDAKIQAEGQVVISSPDSVVIQAPTLTVQGNINASGNIVDGGINTNHHVH